MLWLGGSACSGKTEVARRLAAEHGIAVVSADDTFERLRGMADPSTRPAFCRVGDLPPERLLEEPAARQAEELRAFHREHLEMLLADLVQAASAASAGPAASAAADAPEATLLVEGACLLPADLAGLLARPRQALWLVATPALRRRAYRGRGPWVDEMLARCARPSRAFARWMERDDILARWRMAEAARLGLAAWRIDGSQPVEAIAAAAALHFGLAEASGSARAAAGRAIG